MKTWKTWKTSIYPLNRFYRKVSYLIAAEPADAVERAIDAYEDTCAVGLLPRGYVCTIEQVEPAPSEDDITTYVTVVKVPRK